jgi:hypothetical protein
MFRPGVLIESEQVGTFVGDSVEKDRGSRVTISAAIEAEAFLADNISISAAHGVANVNDKRIGLERPASFGTFGEDFTTLGFHVYLWGGEEAPE